MKSFSYQILYIILEHMSKDVTYASYTEMKNNQPRQLQHRINANYKAVTRMNIDLTVMPRSYKGCRFILVVIDEVTSFIVTVPIYPPGSEEIGAALCRACDQKV